MNQTAAVTDPALELVELCNSLIVSDRKPGTVILADRSGFPQWSGPFYRLIYSIIERTELVNSTLADCDIDPMVFVAAGTHLGGIREAFSPPMLSAAWNTSPSGMTLLREHTPPIRMLSTVIRQRIRYPKLTAEEASEIAEAAEELLGWLREHQLQEHDAIRAALVDGLEQFVFRARNLTWFGWGYTYQSLREVIGAYLALERGLEVELQAGMPGAMLRKVWNFLSTVGPVVGKAKDATDKGQFLLSLYGGYHLLVQHGPTALLKSFGV